jgi:beta-glucosidase
VESQPGANPFRSGFLWGAATAPHQVEGNNINSDWWALEQVAPGMQPSGDALDSYHRYPEDMRLLAGAGLNTYRFGIEWARIEPLPGRISRSLLAHYRRMIDQAIDLGLTPMVTLHHFTNPRWFSEQGGWTNDAAIARFTAYTEAVTPILDGVEWICTINEPNMLALMAAMGNAAATDQPEEWTSPTVEAPISRSLPDPDPQVGARLIAAHHAVSAALRSRTGAKVGWSIANEALEAAPGCESKLHQVQEAREMPFVRAGREDDFIGVQSYSSQLVDETGLLPHPPAPGNTQVGTAYRPDALGIAVRQTWEATGGVPIVVTENGIATDDDDRRIAYTREALRGLAAAMRDGVDVRGYLHWSALDNYEWGHWEPTFGLIAVDHESFARHPKPSLGWLGSVALSSGATALHD